MSLHSNKVEQVIYLTHDGSGHNGGNLNINLYYFYPLTYSQVQRATLGIASCPFTADHMAAGSQFSALVFLSGEDVIEADELGMGICCIGEKQGLCRQVWIQI